MDARDERIEKRSLEDQAADRLRGLIIAGELAAGARLTETPLAQRLGLSRGTVRAALRRLVAEGLVCQVPYAGYRVVEFTAEDFWEIFTLRAALEGLAARLAAERGSAEGAQALRAAFDELMAAAGNGDSAAVSRLDHALHRQIVAMTGHARLADHYARVENQFRAYIALSNADVGCADVGESHRALVEAICASDPERAERAARANISPPDALASGAEVLARDTRDGPA